MTLAFHPRLQLTDAVGDLGEMGEKSWTRNDFYKERFLLWRSAWAVKRTKKVAAHGQRKGRSSEKNLYRFLGTNKLLMVLGVPSDIY